MDGARQLLERVLIDRTDAVNRNAPYGLASDAG